MKTILLTIFLSLTCTLTFAENHLLNKLPYGIKIGVTNSDSVESRGKCFQKSKIRDNYYRCAWYDMNGHFHINMSQNETVTKLYWTIRNSDIPKHKLPRAWVKTGFKWGIWVEDFVPLIKSLGATDIEVKDVYSSKHVNFYVGSYYYEAQLETYQPSNDKPATGFHTLKITESF